jgi:nuclear pore complex protein Nup54
VTQPQSSGLLSGNTLGTGGLFSTKTSVAPAQNQADSQVQFAQLQQRIEAIVGAWNPTSPLNRFQVKLHLIFLHLNNIVETTTALFL